MFLALCVSHVSASRPPQMQPAGDLFQSFGSFASSRPQADIYDTTFHELFQSYGQAPLRPQAVPPPLPRPSGLHGVVLPKEGPVKQDYSEVHYLNSFRASRQLQGLATPFEQAAVQEWRDHLSSPISWPVVRDQEAAPKAEAPKAEEASVVSITTTETTEGNLEKGDEHDEEEKDEVHIPRRKSKAFSPPVSLPGVAMPVMFTDEDVDLSHDMSEYDMLNSFRATRVIQGLASPVEKKEVHVWRQHLSASIGAGRHGQGINR